MTQGIKLFAISERQWPRAVRISHYKAQLAAAPNKLAAKHWRRLLAMSGAK
jgi:hypothetical protein